MLDGTEAFYPCQSAWQAVLYSDGNKRACEINCHRIRDVQSNKSIFIILKKWSISMRPIEKYKTLDFLKIYIVIYLRILQLNADFFFTLLFIINHLIKLLILY